VAGLRAVSPSLYFDELTISGKLSLSAGNGETVLHVRNFVVTNNGSIGATWGTCEYLPSPSLTVLATGNVVIDGPVDLHGRSGKRVLESATCGSCYGEDGGDLTLVGHAVAVNDYLSANGGFGSQSVYVDYDNRTHNIGCRGGDAGDMVVSANQRIDIDGTMHAEGGWGGSTSASMGGGNANAGVNGAVYWDAPLVAVQEQESNGVIENAQRMAFSPLSVSGSISANDDIDTADHSGMRQVSFTTFTDRIEDLYVVTNDGTGSASYAIELIAESGDLDLYIIDEAGWNIVQQSNGPSGSESVTVSIPAGGSRFIGISHCTGSPATDYTLEIR